MVMDSDTHISENATGASVTPEPLVHGVSVVPVEGKGRGLVATRAFKVGDVLVEEAPYAAVVSLQEMESTCSGDFTPLDTVVASTCSGCKRLRYSSKAAQKADWAAGHKYECKTWKKLQAEGFDGGEVPETPVRMLCRCLWARELDRTRRKRGDELPFWHSYDSVASLVHHTEAGSGMSKKKRELNKFIATKALSSMPLTHVTVEEAEVLLGQINANANNLDLPNGTSVGTGLYTFSSMGNHSDQPNATQHFTKGRLQMRIIRPIEAGEEVCVSYRDLSTPSFDRRRHMLYQFCFDNRPDLPHTGSMPSARAQRISAAVEARIVRADVSKLLLTHDADAALCELQPPSAGADGGTPAQHCWACLTTPLLEQDGEKLEGGGSGGASEEPLGDCDTALHPATARTILHRGWRPPAPVAPSGGGAAPPSLPARWQQQLANDNWRVLVLLFGDWTAEHSAAEPSAEDAGEHPSARWLQVASAAAFGAAGLRWAEALLDMGEVALGRDMLLAVEAAGVAVGLAGSHELLQQARLQLMQYYTVNGDSGLAGACAQKLVCGMERIYLAPWYYLGITYRALGDTAALAGDVAAAARRWGQALECMHALMGGDAAETRNLSERLRLAAPPVAIPPPQNLRASLMELMHEMRM